MSGPRRGRWRAGVVAATIGGYAAVNWLILTAGYPHEDAYILFRYAEHLAAGDGLAWNPGGSPVEGATDFLWTVVLGGMSAVGVSPGVGAALVNSAAAGAIAWMLSSYASFDELESPWRGIVAAVLPLSVVLSPIASASYHGFGAMAFAAGSLGLFCLYHRPGDTSLRLLPLLGVTVALIRPEGFLIAGLFLVLALVRAGREGRFRGVLVTTSIAAAVGIGYWLWRYHYFEHPAPLAAYVKGYSAGSLPGLSLNLRWGVENGGWLALAGFSIANADRRKPWLLGAIPFVGLVGALLFVEQTQNIAFRYQAPALAFALLAVFRYVGSVGAERRSPLRNGLWAALLCAVVLVPAGLRVQHDVRTAIRGQYVDVFPALLAKHVDSETRMAVTEAGRMAYWTGASTLDLVGLNSSKVAIDGLEVEALEDEAPNLIMVHTAGTLSPFEPRGRFFSTTIRAIRAHLREPYRKSPSTIRDPVRRAPVVVYEYLRSEPSQYNVFLVEYTGGYRHLYAVHSDFISEGEFERLLDESFRRVEELSYVDLLGANPRVERASYERPRRGRRRLGFR